jgi:hypothetical protein
LSNPNSLYVCHDLLQVCIIPRVSHFTIPLSGRPLTGEQPVLLQLPAAPSLTSPDGY